MQWWLALPDFGRVPPKDEPDGAGRYTSSAGPILSSLQGFLAVMLLFSCRAAPVQVSCPPGARLMGAPPPKGSEVWCEKNIAGNSVKDGPFIVYAPSGGKMIEGTYRDGAQEGEWTLWYENGARASSDHYVKGLQSGLHTSWYANGQKAIEGEYRGGKRDGAWLQWDPSGLNNRKMVYRDGKVEK
jgi:hypothetical protein